MLDPQGSLSSSFKVTFLSLVGESVQGEERRLNFVKSFAVLWDHLLLLGSFSQCGRVSLPSDCPRHPWGDLSVGARPAGFLFYRWTWNRFCSHQMGNLRTSLKRRPCEPSAFTVA